MTNVTKGLHRGLRTGLRVGWQKGGKPVLSKFVRLPFRDEAAELITSLWQRGAVPGAGICRSYKRRAVSFQHHRARLLVQHVPCVAPVTTASCCCSLPCWIRGHPRAVLCLIPHMLHSWRSQIARSAVGRPPSSDDKAASLPIGETGEIELEFADIAAEQIQVSDSCRTRWPGNGCCTLALVPNAGAHPFWVDINKWKHSAAQPLPQSPYSAFSTNVLRIIDCHPLTFHHKRRYVNRCAAASLYGG